MDKTRNHRPQLRGVPDSAGGRFEYDRADEKRKIHEEIEDFLEERDQRRPADRH